MSLEKDFVPYQQSFDMKSIGFDEECFAYYYNKELSFGARIAYGEVIESPLYQQAFSFFREKYKLEGLILPQDKGAIIDEEPIYFIAIISYKNNKMEELFNSTNKETLLHYNPREGAEFACLCKLIEIVK